jgi:hypothetical protein
MVVIEVLRTKPPMILAIAQFACDDVCTMIEGGRMERQVPTEVDLERPPAEPPIGCLDPFLWRLAFEHFASHGADEQGRCARCRTEGPCAGLLSARQGLATSIGDANDMSDYWLAYAQVRRRDIAVVGVA